MNRSEKRAAVEAHNRRYVAARFAAEEREAYAMERERAIAAGEIVERPRRKDASRAAMVSVMIAASLAANPTLFPTIYGDE